MTYYAKVELYPTQQKPRHVELLKFVYSEAEPVTPYEKAVRQYGVVGEVLEVIPEEDM